MMLRSPIDQLGRLIVLAPIFSILCACSMLTDSLTRSASEIATQNAVKAIREVDMDRQVDVTLIGGRVLNTTPDAVSRPVKACVYLVQNPDWRPPSTLDGGDCANREQNTSLIAAERRVVAPGQIQQFQLKAPGAREAWLLIDADFAVRPPDYAPLSLRVEGRGVVRMSAWVDGNTIFDGRRPPSGLTTGHSLATPNGQALSSGVGDSTTSPPGPSRQSQGAPDLAPGGDTGADARAGRMQAARAKASATIPAAEPSRRIGLTLVGGSHLNAASGETARPVLICSYLVARHDWWPSTTYPAADGAPLADEPGVLTRDCRLVHPNELHQVQFEDGANRGTELWLLVDAHYDDRPMSYRPLKVSVGASGSVQMSAWLQGKSVFDARQPLPELSNVAPSDPSTGRAPMRPLQPLSPNATSLPAIGPTIQDALGGPR